MNYFILYSNIRLVEHNLFFKFYSEFISTSYSILVVLILAIYTPTDRQTDRSPDYSSPTHGEGKM